MKIISFLIMLMPVFSFCQVTKVRAFQKSEFNRSDTSSNLEWKECNALLVVDQIKFTITIYEPKEYQYDLIKAYPSTRTNEQTTTVFDAIDDNGEKCKIKSTNFLAPQGIHQGTWTIEYVDHFIAYRLKKS